MFEIDKKKFGAFIAELRKENHLTQKELAERLFISDKAVSKWETGSSLPDTALFIPLADLLGVSVTELFMCEKVAQDESLETDKVEDIVKAAITYADESPERAYQVKSKWTAFYGISFLAGCGGMFLNLRTAQPNLETLPTIFLLCVIFGVYFCCFVKIKLPAFYDENKINAFYDGIFNMSMPGMRFNNNNWKYIVKYLRIFFCMSLLLFPMVNLIAGYAIPNQWAAAGNYILLFSLLCGVFLPVYVIGKKYE